MLDSIAAGAARWLRARKRPAAPPRRPFPHGAGVAFVVQVEAPTRVNPDEAYDSSIASTRLRVIAPARQLARRVPVWLVPLEEFLRDPALSGLGNVGAVVVGKLPTQEMLRLRATLAELLARAGAPRPGTALYADLPDDLAALGKAMGAPFLAEYQKGLGACCTFIAPCRALAESVARDARRGIVVVEDPYETPQRAVRATASSPLRLMWFGNLGLVNAPALEAELAALAGRFRDTALHVEMVAHGDVAHLAHAMDARLRAAHPDIEIGFTAWSLQATDEALQRSDFVLIPQDFRSEWGRVKSHNRLVTAIRGGRLAIASPIPAYRELADYARIGADLAAGLRWALARPEQAAARVLAGQRHVAQRFAPETIGRKWAAALGIDG